MYKKQVNFQRIVCFCALIAGAVFFVYGLMNAIQDRAKELPVIGKIRILK